MRNAENILLELVEGYYGQKDYHKRRAETFKEREKKKKKTKPNKRWFKRGLASGSIKVKKPLHKFVKERDNKIIWYDGTWIRGTWEDGEFRGGSWKSGTWKDGDWIGGTWFDGTWEGGYWIRGDWVDGTWKDGYWEDGVFKGGTWKNGDWHGGEWRDGTWEDGIWHDGDWVQGEWKGGTWKKGRIYDNDFKRREDLKNIEIEGVERFGHYVKSVIDPKEYAKRREEALKKLDSERFKEDNLKEGILKYIKE